MYLFKLKKKNCYFYWINKEQLLNFLKVFKLKNNYAKKRKKREIVQKMLIFHFLELLCLAAFMNEFYYFQYLTFIHLATVLLLTMKQIHPFSLFISPFYWLLCLPWNKFRLETIIEFGKTKKSNFGGKKLYFTTRANLVDFYFVKNIFCIRQNQ